MLNRLFYFCAVLCAVALCSGCARFGEFAQKRADKEALKIIQDKQRNAGVSTTTLSVSSPDKPDALTQRVLSEAPRRPFSEDSLSPPRICFRFPMR